MGHPNASVAAVTGSLATLLVWGINRAGGHVNQAEAMGIATGAVSAVLFVGRRGLKATIASVWNGSPAAKAAK